MLLVAGLMTTANVQSVLEEPKWGGTIILGSHSDLKSFMVLFSGDDLGQTLQENIFDALITVDWSRWQIIKGLAHSWEVSPDELTYTFHLYDNVTWHDGVNFTSADVKFTIEGATFGPTNRATGLLAGIKEVRAPDNYTAEIILENPNANFLNNLAALGRYCMCILPEHLYNGTDWIDNPHNLNPIGTGPFKFVGRVPGSSVTLEANKNYYRGRPYADKLIVKIVPSDDTLLEMLRVGEVHYLHTLIFGTSYAKLAEIADWTTVRIHAIPQMVVNYIGFNLNRTPFDDVEVRKAFTYGIDREEIIDRVYWGYGGSTDGWYSQSHAWAFNPNAVLPNYDPEMAETILDDAGYPEGPGGIRFTAELSLAGPITGFLDVSAVMKEQLLKIGIDLVIVPMDFTTWVEKACRRHDFDISLRGYNIGPDPDKIRAFLTPGVLYNFMGYNNTEVMQLFEEGVLTTDIEERQEIYWSMQEILKEDIPYIMIVEPAQIFIANNEWHQFATDWSEIDPDHPAPVRMSGFRLAWWENGAEISPLSAADAITEAEEAISELEEQGYDMEEARALLEEAKGAYEAGDYVKAYTDAKDASSLAVAPPPYMLYAGIVVVVVVIVIGAVLLYRRRRRKT